MRKILKLLIRFTPVVLWLWLGLLSEPLPALPPIQRMVLPNGLVLLHCEERSLPFATFQLLIDAGSRLDPPGKEGLAYLAARGLLLGTSKQTSTAINETLDFMGASLNASSGRDYATLSLRVLKKDIGKGTDLFMETLTKPAYPDGEIQKEIDKMLAAIQSAEDDPGHVAQKAFQKALFLQGPYRHPVEGTKESVKQLTREGVLQFNRTYYHPTDSILSVVGHLTAEELKSKVLPLFERWPRKAIPKKPFPIEFAKGPMIRKIDKPITQANVIIGHKGISRQNPDFYALTVMNYMLGGGGFASRLVDEIRIKRGLAYSVASFFNPGKYPGAFQVILQTKNSSAREAIAIALQEMQRIRNEPISEKELEGAKKYLIGSFPMRLDTQGKLVNFLTQVEYYQLGLDYPIRYPSLIQSVTREEVLRVAKGYLHPENYILVVVANLKEAGMD